MYAGALPFSQVKPGQDLVEFNKELNDNLSSSFGLACQTRKDITLSEGFGSKDVQMLLSDVTNSEELAIIRSELSFLINQNPNCKLRFATSHHQILNNPELVLNQISAFATFNGTTNPIMGWQSTTFNEVSPINAISYYIDGKDIEFNTVINLENTLISVDYTVLEDTISYTIEFENSDEIIIEI